MRYVKVLYTIVLLLFLTAATAGYCYEYSDFFHDNIDEYIPQATPFLLKLLQFHEKYDLNTRYGIGLVFLLVLITMVKAFLEKPAETTRPNTVLVFFSVLSVVFLIGSLATIYFWPSDIIRFGNLWQFNRGPREVFLDNILHIGTLILILHLYYLLLWRLYLWTGPKKKKPNDDFIPPQYRIES